MYRGRGRKKKMMMEAQEVATSQTSPLPFQRSKVEDRHGEQWNCNRDEMALMENLRYRKTESPREGDATAVEEFASLPRNGGNAPPSLASKATDPRDAQGCTRGGL